MRGPGSRRRTPLGARVRVPGGLYRLLSQICESASSRSFDLPGSSRNGSIYREPREWKGCRRVHFIDGSEVSSHSGGARKQAGPTAATIPPNGGSRTENPHPRRRYSCNQPRRTLALAARGETFVDYHHRYQNSNPCAERRSHLFAATRRARYNSCESPSLLRSSRSKPAIGYRFCGALESLYSADANRTRVVWLSPANAMTSSRGRPGEHSTRTIPAHGALGRQGSRRYQEYRSQFPPIRNTGVRWQACRVPTIACCSVGRYAARWLLM